MSKLEEFYNALIKDPDLEIRGGQTREQAAMQEAQHRARQYNNNAQALAMATDVSKSPIDSLLDFVSKEYKGVSDEGIKAIHENLPEHGPVVNQRKPVRLPNPAVPAEKKSKKKEGTEFTGELVRTRPEDAAGQFTQETKYETTNKPSTTNKVKNLIDTVYQRAEEANLSEEETQNLINETFNNPDYYTDKENLDELRTLRTNVNSVNDSKRSSKIADPPEYEIKFVGGTRGRATEEQRKNQKEVRNLIDDVRQTAENDNLSEEETQNLINETLNDAEILAPVGGFTPAKPTIARRETDGHIERYSAAKETLGNTKPEKAVWETEGPEQNQFNGLAPEIKQVLNNIHSEANSNSKLTAAQQTVLLDIFDDESSGGAIRGIHDAIRDPDTGDWKTANDLTSGEADKILAYSELEEANLQVRNKNVKDIAGKALERLGNNSESLELSDTQLNHIQDRISGENIDKDISSGIAELRTASAEPEEAIPDSEYPYKSQLEGGQKSTNTSKIWLDNAKKFLFPGQSRVSNDVLASKLQSMANDGHFEADNPIYDGVKGAKSEGSQHTKDGDAKVQNASAILTLFNNDNEVFSSYKATPNQASETEKRIRDNKKAQTAVIDDPSDSKKQEELTETTEEVKEAKDGDNKNENDKNDKEDLKDLSNIEIKDNELVVDDQNKETKENIQTVIENPVSDANAQQGRLFNGDSDAGGNESEEGSEKVEGGGQPEPVVETPKAEGGTPETPTIDENIQTLINDADEDKTLKHMYEKEYGENNKYVSYESYKEDKTEEFQKSGEKKASEILGKAHKTMKDLKVKQDKESSKETQSQKTERIKQEQEQEKQAKVDAAEQKEIDDVKAYGVSDEARMARQIEEGQGGSDLMFHLDEKGEISHETHGGVDDETGEHKNINDHDKKEKGSHPAHHHNKMMSSNLPPALREIEEEQAKEGDANEKIISDNRQFLQQKAQQGYMWNPNTKHWIHKENFSNLMSGHVGTNATIANGNHSRQGTPTFLEGNGNAAQGIFHLGTGYKVHKFGVGAVGKHLESQHSKTGALASHLDSKLSATKVGDASGIYNSSGIGVPKAVKPKGFAQGMKAGASGSQSGFNISPMVAGWRKVLGLEKSFMTNDALQQLVESYSHKNKKI